MNKAVFIPSAEANGFSTDLNIFITANNTTDFGRFFQEFFLYYQLTIMTLSKDILATAS